jgi:hypothetical protein
MTVGTKAKVVGDYEESMDGKSLADRCNRTRDAASALHLQARYPAWGTPPTRARVEARAVLELGERSAEQGRGEPEPVV